MIDHPIANATPAATFMTEDRVLHFFQFAPWFSSITRHDAPRRGDDRTLLWRRLSQSKSSTARCNKSPRLCGDRSKTGQLDGPLPLLLAGGSSDSH